MHGMIICQPNLYPTYSFNQDMQSCAVEGLGVIMDFVHWMGVAGNLISASPSQFQGVLVGPLGDRCSSLQLSRNADRNEDCSPYGSSNIQLGSTYTCNAAHCNYTAACWLLDLTILLRWLSWHVVIDEWFLLQGIRHIHSTPAKVQRVLRQFTPFSWTNYTWETFTSYKRLCQVLSGIAVFLTGEANAFFLKYVLTIHIVACSICDAFGFQHSDHGTTSVL